jgi:perosamine synthetase
MIYLDNPNFDNKELYYLQKALESGYVSTVGPMVQEFEQKMVDYLQVKHCIATQNGTAALHISLIALGIGAGDEVILPAITFVATANAVRYVGATPIFVDIDPDTWNIDPAEIEKAITPKTKAIIPVHLYGNPCDMNTIMDIAKKHNLYIIEDACESLGATYQGKHTGKIGDIGCFSFNGNKIITTGGGGMVATNDDEIARKIRYLIHQAKPDFQEVGFNYSMTNIEAALGLAQMEKLKEFSRTKIFFNGLYSNLRSGITQKVIFNENTYSNCWFTAIKLDIRKIGKTIPQIQEELKQYGIPTRRIFEPITSFKPYHVKQNVYDKLNTVIKLSNSYDLYNNGLCLPSSTKNSIEDIEFVCEKLKEVCNL